MTGMEQVVIIGMEQVVTATQALQVLTAMHGVNAGVHAGVNAVLRR